MDTSAPDPWRLAADERASLWPDVDPDALERALAEAPAAARAWWLRVCQLPPSERFAGYTDVIFVAEGENADSWHGVFRREEE